MGRSRKHSAALKAKRVGEKPRGFYESPSNEAIVRYLSDPELHTWIKQKTGWTDLRIWQLLKMLGEKLKADKRHDVRLFDTQSNATTIGMNTGTWVLWVQLPMSSNLMGFALTHGIVSIDDVAPDWRKSVFDLEFNFTADTKCLHEVIYLRGEGTCGAMGDTLNQAIECFGGLSALDGDVFNTTKDKESFKNLFNPMIQSITFGDEDYGFQINRGSAISQSEYAA